MSFRLYLMCHRVEALVASQLAPEEFGNYMAVGTNKQTSGKVIFFEINPDKIDAGFFDLDRARRECVSRPDGTRKRSKYVRIYRVLEHIPLDAYGTLHLTTRDGRVLGLDGKPYAGDTVAGPNLYQELCPVNPLVCSSLGPADFARFLTDPKSAVSVPRLFFADLLLDREPSGALASYLPYRDPAHIANCVRELAAPGREKKSKTVDRLPNFEAFYRTIRRGFFIGDQTGVRHYPYPSADELDEKHFAWWRSASMG